MSKTEAELLAEVRASLKSLEDGQSELSSEVRSIREGMGRFATKDDLERFATKEDLGALGDRLAVVESSMATKDDLERFATKDDLKRFATKDDIADLRTILSGHTESFVSIEAALKRLNAPRDARPRRASG